MSEIGMTKDEVVYLALQNGNISRGSACEVLGIERWELDKWIEKYETLEAE